jgi:hypothetical protein
VSHHRLLCKQSNWQQFLKLNHREGVRGGQIQWMNHHWNVWKGSRQLIIWTLKVNQTLHNFPFCNFSKDDVISNLDAVGINLGHDYTTIDSSISNLRHVKLDRLVCKPKVDLIEDIFDVEEEEEMGNEEVDKLILNSLCSEIMDEVMDLGNAYPNGCNITPRARSSSTPTDSAKRKKQKRSV